MIPELCSHLWASNFFIPLYPINTPVRMLIHVEMAYTKINDIIVGKPEGAKVKKYPTISMQGDKNIESNMAPKTHLCVPVVTGSK